MRDITAGRPEYDVVILTSIHRIGLFQTGTGYRYLDFALELQARDIRVAIVAPEPTDFEDCPVNVLDRSTIAYAEICSTAQVFVFCLLEDQGLVELLKANGKTLIYDSFLSPVEHLSHPEVRDLGDAERIEACFHDVIRKHDTFNGLADYFIVGEFSEKLLKLGELINTLRVGIADYETLGDRIFPLPVIGYSKHNLPTGGLRSTENNMLWNGGLWNHYCGTDLIIDAVASLRKKGSDVTFQFLYPRERQPAHAQILRRIETEDISFIRLGLPNGRRPDFFEKQPIVAGCRALVVLYEPVLQMHLFPSMRLREVLLYEKPIIVSKYGVQGALVAERGIGLTVDNTVESVRDAMERLMTDTMLYETLVENIRRLKPHYDFDNYVPAVAEVITAANGDRRSKT